MESNRAFFIEKSVHLWQTTDFVGPRNPTSSRLWGVFVSCPRSCQFVKVHFKKVLHLYHKVLIYLLFGAYFRNETWKLPPGLPHFGPCENLLRLLHPPTAAVAREVTISLPHPEDLEVVGIASRPVSNAATIHGIAPKGLKVLILGMTSSHLWCWEYTEPNKKRQKS